MALRKKKRWNWSAIIISLILVSSTFAVIFYGFGPNTDTKHFNDYKFTRSADGWQTTINGNQIFFNYLPDEVESIPFDTSIASPMASSPEIDITSSFNDTNAQTIALAQSQFEQVAGQLSQIYVRKGFDANTTYDFPIITCTQAQNVPIIYMKTGQNLSVSKEGLCIIAQGSNAQDFIKIKDKILYAMYGVLQ